MNRILAIAPAILLWTACGGFTPATGTWTVNSQEVISDTCGFDADEDDPDAEASTFVLNENDDGTITFAIDSFGVQCGLRGKELNCEPETSEDAIGEDTDATFIITLEIDGSFADEETLDAHVGYDIDCEGGDCEAIGAYLEVTFPCSIGTDMNATWTSAD